MLFWISSPRAFKLNWPIIPKLAGHQTSLNMLSRFLMYLTMFRTVRATEVLSVHGYPLQGYALQREH